MNTPADSAERAERMRAATGRLRGCLIGMAAICLLIPVGAALSYGWDAAVDAPWAYPLFGRPTLTGTWEGEFRTPGGSRFAIFMDLSRKFLSNGTPHDEDYQGALMTGEARWCDDRGRHADHIVIDGAVPVFTGYNGTADQVEIDLESASYPQPGLFPDTFKGSWNVTTLSLQPTFMYWTGSTFEYSSNNPDLTSTISVTLNKAGEGAYRTACAALGNSLP